MIRAFYVKSVLMFFVVVLISLALSFFISSRFLYDRFFEQLENELIADGKQIIQLYQTSGSGRFEPYMRSIALLKKYNLYLYTEDRREMTFLYTSEERAIATDPRVVDHVLNGGVYRGVHEGGYGNPSQRSVGVPFQWNGRSYALFIQPNFREHLEQIRFIQWVVLGIALSIGMLIYLIATRYLVKPLNALIEGTRRIARGDFDTKVEVCTKDELGLLAKSFNEMAHELKQLDQMRGDFVSNVSHEIQSPLTSIRGFSRALQASGLSDEERLRYSSIIEEEATRLSRLSEHLLHLAALEAGQHPFSPQAFRVDEQILRVVFAHEPQVTGKGLSMKLHLPEVKIHGDEALLNQVWTNLLHNAIKFSPSGGGDPMGAIGAGG